MALCAQGEQSQKQRSQGHHGCRGAERRSEVLHTPALPQQPEQVRTVTPLHSPCLPACLLAGLQWGNNFLLNANKQDAAGADGGAAAADAQVGSSAERRASQLGH